MDVRNDEKESDGGNADERGNFLYFRPNAPDENISRLSKLLVECF